MDSYDTDNMFDEIDKLGDLELEELDNIVSFADNMATQYAIQTTEKLQKLGQKNIKNMNEKRLKMLNDYKKKKEILQKYIGSAPFTRTYDKFIFIFGVL
jgi:uncharacterized protein (DUF885 family)